MRTAWILFGAVVMGCGGGSQTTGSGGAGATSTSDASTATSGGVGGATSASTATGGACVPGQQIPCGCVGGTTGAQVCKGDGSGFGACMGCDATGSGGGGGGGAPGGCSGPYPAGPYGLNKGSTIDSFTFTGFVDATKDSVSIQQVELCDFYNPTGNAVYPPGSQYGAGTAMPKALLIVMSSVWSGPCNSEAKTELPPKHAQYKPMGGEFLSMLVDGPVPGQAATYKHLANWCTKYATDYPNVIDMAQSFPMQMVVPTHFMVDLATMKISDVILGVPDSAAWAKFEALLQ